MNNPLKTLYCISGLGADEKVFSKLKIVGYELKVIPWLLPLVKETIQEYAARMRSYIKEENPILMGLSFGGMVSIEIARQIPVQKIILISSIKTRDELPSWMKLVAKSRLNKVYPMRPYKLTAPIQNFMLGLLSKEEKDMVLELRRKAHIDYTSWAVNQAINWKNDSIPTTIFHIHGDNDKMFPIKRIKADQVIKSGGHFMIMNQADTVSTIINKWLAGK